MDFAPVAYTTERLALLSLDEAHDLLRLLLAVTQVGGELSEEADRLAREIAARIRQTTDRRSSPAACAVF